MQTSPSTDIVILTINTNKEFYYLIKNKTNKSVEMFRLFFIFTSNEICPIPFNDNSFHDSLELWHALKSKVDSVRLRKQIVQVRGCIDESNYT